MKNKGVRAGNAGLFGYVLATGSVGGELSANPKKACNLSYLEFSTWDLVVKKYQEVLRQH